MIEIRDDIIEQLKRFDPELLSKAQRSTLTRVRTRTATFISRAVRERYSVTARTVSDALSRRVKIVVRRDETTAVLEYIGQRIGLINFSAQIRRVATPAGPRFGATTKLYKDKRRFLTKRGFVASGANNNVHIFQREKQGQQTRLPISAMYGPSVPQMVGSTETLDKANEFVGELYPVELMRQIDYQLSRL